MCADAGGSRGWFFKSKLWLVTDSKACSPRSIPQMLSETIPAGIDVVMLRMKDATDRQLLDTAREVRRICSLLNVPLVVSHSVHTALAVSADGIHLSSSDPAFAGIRSLLPTCMTVGVSTHCATETHHFLAHGADYVFLGPIFATPAKLKYGDPLGLNAVSATADQSESIVYIGGITPDNVRQVITSGGKKVAAIRALQTPPDCNENISRLQAELTA